MTVVSRRMFFEYHHTPPDFLPFLSAVRARALIQSAFNVEASVGTQPMHCPTFLLPSDAAITPTA